MSTPEITPEMTFPDLDSAESALDWIGLDFVEGQGDGAGEGAGSGTGDAGGWFTGELDAEAVELIDTTLADDETPLEVRALAQVLRERWNDEAAPRAWRVTFPA